MLGKDTAELLKELRATKDLAAFLKRNAENMVQLTFTEYLCALKKAKGISAKDIIAASGLDKSYVYHVLSGERKPSRARLLAMALAMGLTLDETQYLLQYAGFSRLYVREPWDSIIIHALNHQKSVADTNLLLYDFREKTLLE